MGGFSLSSPFGIVICVSCDLSFYVVWLFLFFVFSSLCWLSLLFLFVLFRFSVLFLFTASSSRSLSLPPSPLSSCYFLAFPSSALFSLWLFFSSLFSSRPSPLPHPPFRSHFGSFFSLLWPLFLDFLFPFSSSCLSFSSSFCPLPSPLFLFHLRFFPSTLFFPSCWLFFLLVSPRCLFGGFLVFLFAFLAFGLRFLSVCVFGLFWCFSVFLVLVFSVPEFSFVTIHFLYT